ncbi:hypothetical protein [Nocardioides rubriscoriae]|uniref:hypothetical protein n=1 Tax=Nocardioides rubriscoriae TaxID=642762 RepID=UPI0011DFA8AB|nr:hypothetical protein [Nocardioides rubriscoriae]
MGFLLRTWLRPRLVGRSFAYLVVGSCLAMLVYGVVQSLTLTAAQQQQRDFGSSQSMSYDNVALGSLGPDDLARTRSAVQDGLPGSAVFLQTTQLRPDVLPPNFVQAPVDTVTFIEGADYRQAFGDQVGLLRGRWAGATGEVTVSERILDAIGGDDTLTIYSGRKTLKVVGVYQDDFAADSYLLFAGEGTFESIRPASVDKSFQPVYAQVRVLMPTSAASQVDEALGILADQLPTLPDGQGTRPENLSGNLAVRGTNQDGDSAAFGREGDVIVSFGPPLILLAGAAFLAAGQQRRRHEEVVHLLHRLGGRPSRVLLSRTASYSIVALMSLAAGTVVSIVVLLFARATALPAVAGQPLAPLDIANRQVAVLVAVGALTYVVATAAGDGGLGPRWASAVGSKIPRHLIRRTAGVLAVLSAIRVGDRVETALAGPGDARYAAYAMVAGFCLLAPDFLRVTMWLTSRSSLPLEVASRLMQANLPRFGAAVSLGVMTLGIPVALLVHLDSEQGLTASARYGIVPEGQMWVQSSDTSRDIATVAAVIGDTPGATEGVAFRTLTRIDDQGVVAEAARFSNIPGSGSYSTAVLTVDSASDLARALPSLTRLEDAARVLNEGGVVDFTSHDDDDQRLITYGQAVPQETETPSLPTIQVEASPQVQLQFAGVLLTSTAKGLDLPIGPVSRVIFPDMDAATITSATRALQDAGYDPEFGQYAQTPPEPVLPVNAVAFLLVMTLGSIIILTIAISEQARAVSTSAKRLLALGAPPRWLMKLNSAQAVQMVGVSFTAGLTSGLMAVIVSSHAYPALVIHWVPIGAVTGTVLVLSTAAAGMALRFNRVRLTEAFLFA